MNQWKQAFDAMAPSAPKAGNPGMGAGNVPFAPGMMSGKFPGQNPSSRGGSATTTPLNMPSGMPVQSPPAQEDPRMWNAQMSQQVLRYLMGLLDASSPKMKMTTTGGYQPEGRGY